MVGVDGQRVRAALKWKGVSVKGMAARLGLKQQTLDSVVQGKTKRCHKAVRDKLEGFLGIPAAWLAGETDTLPTFTPWLPFPGLGGELRHVPDENMALTPVPPAGIAFRLGLPPGYQLVGHELATEVIRAWKRDVDGGNVSAKEALEAVVPQVWAGRDWERVAWLVHRLVAIFWWRRALIVPLPPPQGMDPNLPEAEYRAAVAALIEEMRRRSAEGIAMAKDADPFAISAGVALKILLSPWFKGEREVRYDQVVAVLRWAAAGLGLTLIDTAADA